MNIDNAAIAKTFYTLMGEKNIEAMEKFVHPDVKFHGPLAKFEGKERYIEETIKFFNLFKSLKIRGAFGADNQAVIVYDLEIGEPVGNMSSVSLMTFEDAQIVKVELFYDSHPFYQKK